MELTIDAASARDRHLWANRVGAGMSFDDLAQLFGLTSRRCRQIVAKVSKQEVENVAEMIWTYQALGGRYSLTVPYLRDVQTPKFRYIAWILSELNALEDEEGRMGEFVISAQEVGDATCFEFTDVRFDADSAQEGAE